MVFPWFSHGFPWFPYGFPEATRSPQGPKAPPRPGAPGPFPDAAARRRPPLFAPAAAAAPGAWLNVSKRGSDGHGPEL